MDDVYFYVYSFVVTLCNTKFNTQKFYVLSTVSIYVLCVDLKTAIISLHRTEWFFTAMQRGFSMNLKTVKVGNVNLDASRSIYTRTNCKYWQLITNGLM